MEIRNFKKIKKLLVFFFSIEFWQQPVAIHEYYHDNERKFYRGVQ